MVMIEHAIGSRHVTFMNRGCSKKYSEDGYYFIYIYQECIGT